jgi:ubiquinone/menaquinone biosynthesis C-methylase UbiE
MLLVKIIYPEYIMNKKIVLLLLVLLLLLLNVSQESFSNNTNFPNTNFPNTKYIITDEEIYYPVIDDNKELEYSRFNYKTKQVKHKYAIEIMNQITEKHKKILVLGVALGGIIINILDKYPKAQVVGIDIIDEFFDLVRKYSDTSRLTLIEEDAEKYIEMNQDLFDIIICDICDGYLIPPFVLNKPFLDKINKMLLPNGKFIINTIKLDDNMMQNTLGKSFINKKIISLYCINLIHLRNLLIKKIDNFMLFII